MFYGITSIALLASLYVGYRVGLWMHRQIEKSKGAEASRASK